MKKNATFFISTGRCATQWLAYTLDSVYKDIAQVTHEPMTTEYSPRQLFRAYCNGNAVTLPKAVQNHIDEINSITKSQSYIETGWPCYGALPFMIDQIEVPVKLVHLFRHPVTTAASLATHFIYQREAEWSEVMVMTPMDTEKGGINIGQQQWDAMLEFEKCLYFWTEINYYAHNLKVKYCDNSWFSIKYEDLVSKEKKGLEKLVAFLNLPYRPELTEAIDNPFDCYSWKSPDRFHREEIEKYPHSLDLMYKLGYNLDMIKNADLQLRYRVSFFNRIKPWFSYLLTKGKAQGEQGKQK